MADLKLKILTPSGIFMDEEAEWINFTNTIGRIEILPGHTTYMSEVLPCLLEIKKSSSIKKLVIAEGFIDFDRDEAVIMTESAQWPENIDKERAQEAYTRARKRLRNPNPDIDVRRAELSLMRANARIRSIDVKSSDD